MFEVRIKGDRAAFVERLRHEAFDCREAEGDLLRVTLPADAGADRLFAAAAGVGAQVRHLRPSVPTLGVSARTGWAAPSRGTPAQRRYGTEWRRIRQRVLERDCYCCKTCEGNVRAGNIVDHIIENKRTAALGTTSRTWKSSAMSITRSRHRLSRTNGGREPRGGGSHISQPIRYRMRSNSRGIHGV